MEIADVDVFNNWILPIIKPICLADPESLARYVVVLLKKNNPKPDLRSYCIQNLSIFIDNSKIKVEDFVDMVLDAVENKKYNPSEQSGKEPASSKPQAARHDINKSRPTSKHTRSRSRSPVSSRTDGDHSSRKSASNARSDDNNNDSRKRRSNSKHSRSRSRSDREVRSRSPHSRGSRMPTGNASENEDLTSKKSGSASHNICPTFEQQGYCLNGDLCTYIHPGSLPVEEKDIQAIAATYQAAATNQLFQPDVLGGFAAHKVADFSQPGLNTSPKNAHISPVLASYLQIGFQQIAAAATVDPLQQQFFQAHQDPNALFAQQFPPGPQQPQKQHSDLLPGEEQQVTSVPVVVSSRQGGFTRRQDMSNMRPMRRNDFGGGGAPRKFDNRFANERPPISASQLDNEMDQITQANAAARLDAATSDQSSQDNSNLGTNVLNEPTPFGGPKSYSPGSGYANRPFGRGRGGGRGFRGRGRGHQLDTSNNVLEVRKIPANLNSIGALHEHFSAFGQVVNIQVNFEGDPEAAIVTFANHTDALGAYRSAQPLFNNRFIRVFWHKEAQQQQQLNNMEQPRPDVKGGQDVEQLQAQQPMKPDTQGQQQQQPGQQAPPQQSATAGPKPPPRAKLRIDHVGDEKAKVTEAQNDLSKRRRLLLANYLEMRKTLADKLAAATTEAMKTEISGTLKTVDEKLSALKSELGLARSEQKAKAQQQNQPAQEGDSGGAAGGTPDAAKSAQKPGSQRAAFIVDRRPKQLLVSLVTGLDAASLRQHFGLFCSVDGVELSSSGFIVTFATRRDAEVAKSRGLVFRGQEVAITWHQPLFYSSSALPFYSSAANNPNRSQQEQQLKSPTSADGTAKKNVGEPEKTSLFDDADSEEERQQQAVETR